MCTVWKETFKNRFVSNNVDLSKVFVMFVLQKVSVPHPGLVSPRPGHGPLPKRRNGAYHQIRSITSVTQDYHRPGWQPCLALGSLMGWTPGFFRIIEVKDFFKNLSMWTGLLVNMAILKKSRDYIRYFLVFQGFEQCSTSFVLFQQRDVYSNWNSLKPIWISILLSSDQLSFCIKIQNFFSPELKQI